MDHGRCSLDIAFQTSAYGKVSSKPTNASGDDTPGIDEMPRVDEISGVTYTSEASTDT